MKSQFVTSSCIGMTKEMEKIEGKANEPVANCDQLPKAIDIQPMIRVIRGQQVIIDRDLALLYGVETKRLNEQVKRNEVAKCDLKLGRRQKMALCFH